MENMTWPEIESAIEKGNDNVIIMAGSIEQHGPHLPIATDTILGYSLAKQVAEKLENTLVAPIIRPGVSEHHMDFPGTISLSAELFMKLLEEYCQALAKHGFKKLILLSSHGGNFAPIQTVAPKIANVLKNDGVKVIPVVNLAKLIEVEFEYLKEGGTSPEKAGVHSGFAETSSMLHESPQLVKMEKAEPGLTERVSPSEVITKGLKLLSPNGILGDPAGASADIGKRLSDILVEYLVEEIRKQL